MGSTKFHFKAIEKIVENREQSGGKKQANKSESPVIFLSLIGCCFRAQPLRFSGETNKKQISKQTNNKNKQKENKQTKNQKKQIQPRHTHKTKKKTTLLTFVLFCDFLEHFLQVKLKINPISYIALLVFKNWIMRIIRLSAKTTLL